MEPLQEIPKSELPKLMDLFRADWPYGVDGYCMLNTQLACPALTEKYNFKYYGTGGDITNGMVAISDKDYYYEVYICPTKAAGIGALEDALVNTNVVDWNREVTVPSANRDVLDCLNRLQNKIGLQINNSERVFKHLLNKDDKPYENISCPENTYVGPLKPEHLGLVNRTWTFYSGKNSYENFETLMRNGLTYVLYSSEDHRPVSWIIVDCVGVLTHLYCLGVHRRKGYSEYITKVAINDLLSQGKDVLAYTLENNGKPQNLFQKLDFNFIGDGCSNLDLLTKDMEGDLNDSLHFVPIEKWVELEKAFKEDWPQGIPAYNALLTQKKIVEMGLDYGFKVYCPFGDTTNGMVALNKKGTLNEIIIQCPKRETAKLEESLTKTKLIDWNSRILVPFMADNIRQCVCRVAAKLKLRLEAEDVEPNELFVLDGDKPRFPNTGIPYDVTFKPLTDDYEIHLVNSNWRNSYDGSLWLFNMLSQAEFGYGLFKNDKLVSWVVINEVGALTHLYTMEENRKKGYAEILLKQICNICLDENKQIFAYCRRGNIGACRLYEKLGFMKLHEMTFNEVIIHCPKDDTTPMQKALVTTKVINWSVPVKICYVSDRMNPCLRTVAEEVGMWCEDVVDHPPFDFVYLSKDNRPFENICLPEDVQFLPVSEEDLDLVDSTWVNNYDSSKWVFNLFIKKNTSYGLYKRNELVTWVFINEIGALTHLYTLENHRKMGYAKLLLQLMCNKRLKEKCDVYAAVMRGNESALKLYISLGFKKLHVVHWFYLNPQ